MEGVIVTRAENRKGKDISNMVNAVKKFIKNPRAALIKIKMYAVRTAKVIVKFVLGFFVCLPYTLDKKTDYFASVFCTGDTLLMAGLFAAFKSRYPQKRVRVIVKKAHEQIIEFYKDEFDDLIYVSNFKAKLIKTYFLIASRFTSRLRYCMPERTLILPDRTAAVRNYCLGLLPSYKRALSLKASSEFARPNYPQMPSEDREQLGRKLGIIPGKTVILAPYTITLEVYDYTAIFTSMARALKEAGYCVLTNTTDDRVIDGTLPLRADLHDMMAVTQDENLWVISVRSGLCDLLYFSKCRLSVIYPDDAFFRLWSLERMFDGRAGLSELIMPPASRDIERVLCREDEDARSNDQ